MLRFTRSESSVDKKVRIVDGAAAKAWLSGMSQPASIQNLAEITEVLNALGASGVQDGSAALEPQLKFAIAERIRAVLLTTLGERAREDRFATLPLDEEFVGHFWASVHAAQALRDVYAWLVSQLPRSQAAPDDPASDIGTTAANAFVSGIGALHRALDVDAQLMLSIQRARWPVPSAMWERHCVLGQLVRDLDCQDVEVVDALRLSQTRTCRSAFVLPVMIALADPAARSSAEFEVVRMAAQRWSTKMGFRLERRNDAGTSPARPVANPGPSAILGSYVVRFDTQSALQSIDKRLEALAGGKSPREVGIGDGLRPQAARDLLVYLRQRWGAVSPADIDSPDRGWRASARGVAVMAVVGLNGREAISGDKAGAARGTQSPYAYQRHNHGGITRPREVVEAERIDQMLARAETWTLVAEAADAFRCIRKHGRPRIGLQRLVGLKVGSSEQDAPFLIGWVEAVQATAVEVDGDDGSVRQSGAHIVRVRLAPGVPHPLVASIDEVDVEGAFLLVPRTEAAQSRVVRAATLPARSGDSRLRTNLLSNEDREGWDPVRASPRDYGLIVPHSSFRPQRLVKAVRHGMLAVLRLEELTMRGSDFDLVRFTPL